jgi:hypothetical protein
VSFSYERWLYSPVGAIRLNILIEYVSICPAGILVGLFIKPGEQSDSSEHAIGSGHMHFYVDESGHTGPNLFDAEQPLLYYGVLSSRVNVDVVAKSLVAIRCERTF